MILKKRQYNEIYQFLLVDIFIFSSPLFTLAKNIALET